MADNDILKIKRITDITDDLKKKDRQRELIKIVRLSKEKFLDAYRPRRQRLLEINAIYRNKSYLDKNKVGWQTKTFLPYSYNAVEKRTSVMHQALWGNRLGSPYTAIGRTPEDHDFALSAEAVLNNTMDRIGFYDTSEEGLRSVCKYGLGVYRYGWVNRKEDMLWREVERDKDGKVLRDELKKPKYRYIKKVHHVNQPYVRAVDIVDHMGWDPTAKKFDKWECGFVYEIRKESPERIYEKEIRGEYEKRSYDRLKTPDPHGINDMIADADEKEPEIRRDEGIEQPSGAGVIRPEYEVCDWFGWFDIDGDGLREFIKATVLLDNDQILKAEQNLEGVYPFVDVQYSKSLHSLTPWGVVDPVVEIQYAINEFQNQRGDSVRLKLHPQFKINVDMVLEDHSYVSVPGAFHPFAVGDGKLNDAIDTLKFDNMEYLGVQEEERLINVWRETTGDVNVMQAISSLDRTPATTLVSLLNEQQATNSMIVNGILNRHGVLGSRVLRLIQLFGDEEFVLRSAGRKGVEFRKESLENILGEYDIKVTTSTFFGNKEMELQQLIQLKPLWAQAPHIDQIEIDKAILEIVLPKKIDKILKVPDEPLTIIEEQALFLAGQGESVKLSELEDLASLTQKLRAHEDFVGSVAYREMDGQDHEEFATHVERIRNRVEELRMTQQLKAAEAARQTELPEMSGEEGRMRAPGSPGVRRLGEVARPMPRGTPGQV